MSSLYYPQLAIGSMAQYPIVSRWSKHAISNGLCDGSMIVMATTRPARSSWELRYTGLSTAEWETLQELFRASAGRFGTFTFIDPTDNLLMWSDDPTANVWNDGPLLQLGT